MEVLRFNDIEWIISDIEGTSTSISFVKDVLFPEARKQLVKFLIENQKNETVIDSLKNLWETYLEDKKKDAQNLPAVDFSNLCSGNANFDDNNLEPFVQYYDWLMGLDRKLGSLKTIQGMIWRAGYENGSIKGHVYPEVPECFEKWSKICNIAIYSSGSVQAQKLLFSFSEFGDLTCYLKDYFDTTNAGPKQVPKSYEIIANILEIEPEKALFLTDSLLEYEAAKNARMKAVLVVRDKQASNAENIIENFEQLHINMALK